MKAPRIVCVALALLALNGGALRAQTVFFDDFENGGANWTKSGLWHVLDANTACGASLGPFPSGSKCAWFGVETAGPSMCSFNDPSTIQGPVGSITLTAPVLLTGTGRSAWLRYTNRADSQGCEHWSDITGQTDGWWLDRPERFVSIDGGANWIRLGADCRGIWWHKGRARLTPYIGEQVLVKFTFTSEDNWDNVRFGWLIDDVEVRLEPGAPACDASAACPCGNFSGEVDERPYVEPIEDRWNLNIGGCTNSLQLKGELWASGVASVSQDSLVLHADDLIPGTTALFLQATATAAATPIADGTSCLAGSIVRLGSLVTPNGVVTYPSPADRPLSATAAAHSTRIYEVHYRNAAPVYCTPGTSNVTNSYSVPWGP